MIYNVENFLTIVCILKSTRCGLLCVFDVIVAAISELFYSPLCFVQFCKLCQQWAMTVENSFLWLS